MAFPPQPTTLRFARISHAQPIPVLEWGGAAHLHILTAVLHNAPRTAFVIRFSLRFRLGKVLIPPECWRLVLAVSRKFERPAG